MSTTGRETTSDAQMTDIFQQSGALFRALIEKSSDAIVLVSREGLFTYVSPSVTKILGFTPEELLGRYTLDLFPPEHLASALENFDRVAKTPGLTVTVEHTYIRRRGDLLFHLASLQER